MFLISLAKTGEGGVIVVAPNTWNWPAVPPREVDGLLGRVGAAIVEVVGAEKEMRLKPLAPAFGAEAEEAVEGGDKVRSSWNCISCCDCDRGGCGWASEKPTPPSSSPSAIKSP